ncbi:hypothetical protein BD779DRAFT_1671502 [Infundibulicybe gibba]|nr:hypothetical protein BD779DRAFT_1671502 [Infundibulicybe gibba]
MPDTDYAKLLDFESVAAAAVFAALYMLFLVWFQVYQLRVFNGPIYVLFLVSLFCAIRFTAFTIRAILAGPGPTSHNLSLLIGDEILFDVGFFVLLYSTYTLALDIAVTSDNVYLFINLRLFRFAMVVAVALGITGVIQSQSTNPHTVDLGRIFQKASTTIFLVLTVLQAYLMVRVAWTEISLRVGADNHEYEFWGVKYGCYIRCTISLLLLVREAFATATVMSDMAKLHNEHFWYPLIALPEILAVILYAIPGTVPPYLWLLVHHEEIDLIFCNFACALDCHRS